MSLVARHYAEPLPSLFTMGGSVRFGRSGRCFEPFSLQSQGPPQLPLSCRRGQMDAGSLKFVLSSRIATSSPFPRLRPASCLSLLSLSLLTPPTVGPGLGQVNARTRELPPCYPSERRSSPSPSPSPATTTTTTTSTTTTTTTSVAFSPMGSNSHHHHHHHHHPISRTRSIANGEASSCVFTAFKTFQSRSALLTSFSSA